MKPRNKYEYRVEDLKNSLPQISAKQIKFSRVNCLDNYSVVSRNRMYCLECNHKWSDFDASKENKCPSCKKKLVTIKENSTYFYAEGYLLIMDVVEEFQVLRYFVITKSSTKTRKPIFYQYEVVQKWISPQGKVTTFSKSRASFYGSKSDFTLSSDLSLKDSKVYDNKYDVNPHAVYPIKVVIPELKRNGFSGEFYDINPLTFLHSLLTNSKAETLLKMGRIDYLKQAVYERSSMVYWGSILVCLKYNYEILDFSVWSDYMHLLEYFGKDLLSVKYACPSNLKKSHNRLLERKKRIDKRKSLEEKRQMKIESQIKYEQEKSRFFGFSFSQDNISVSVINSIEDFEFVGEKLKLCIFENEYYAKAESLLFSVTVEGELLETVEYSFNQKEVVQAFGYDNNPSEYNAKIITLVNQHTEQIMERLAS